MYTNYSIPMLLLLLQIAEPLEDAGLTVEEIATVVGNCYHIVSDIPPEHVNRGYSVSSAIRSDTTAVNYPGSGGGSIKLSRMEVIKKDWLRFITFVKLCVIQLL